jgi:hypothetical protein
VGCLCQYGQSRQQELKLAASWQLFFRACHEVTSYASKFQIHSLRVWRIWTKERTYSCPKKLCSQRETCVDFIVEHSTERRTMGPRSTTTVGRSFVCEYMLLCLFIDANVSFPCYRACRTFNFTSQEELDILICNESSRTITISFRGQVSRSQPRRDLANAHDGKRVWSGGRNSKYEGANSTDLAIMFEALAKHSLFSATPKGKSK